MMMFILAWKNIWRNKKRSLIILAATAIGLAAGLFSVGLMTGMYDSMVDSAIKRGLANIQIHTGAYKKDQLISQFIPHPDSLMRSVRSNSDVAVCASHSIIEGMASSATVASGASIIAVDPDVERTATAIAQSIKEGTYLDKANTVAVGRKLAEKLKLHLRSRLVLSFAGLDGNIIYAAFRISGIYSTDASTFDGVNVFIRQDDLAQLLGTDVPIHEIIVRTKNSLQLDQTRNELQAAMPESVTVETWKEISPEMKLTADSSDIVNTIFLGIILFALLFGLTNTLLMSVLDRVRDFGVLLAVGMFRRRLFSMIILESLFLSFTGGIVGVIIGWALTAYYHTHGINLASVSAGLSSYGIPSMLYPFIKPAMYGTLSLMMIFTSIVAAMYPAIKAIRLRPVEAIRTIA